MVSMSKMSTGWIPPSARSKNQLRMTEEFNERIGRFGLRSTGSVTVPERVLFVEAEIKVCGKPLLRINQKTGSCVGAGSWQTNATTRVLDVAYRGDTEEPVYAFPFATYGVGRRLAGMRTKGEGSFGAAQAKAVHPEHFGWLRMDDKRFPQPKIKDGWIWWTEAQELTWSHPSGWPIKEKELAVEARPFGTEVVTGITDVDELDQAIAQGRGITCASMLGFDRPRVVEDVLVGEWNTEWAHQMGVHGRWLHPKLGRMFLWYNQWNNVHGLCPTMNQYNVNGCVWIKENVMNKVLKSRDTEMFAHSDVGNFETRELNWSDWNADSLGTYN